MIQYQILRTNIKRIVRQTVKRTTNEIMKGLIQLCHCHHCRQVYTHHFFIQGMLVKQVLLIGMVAKETHQVRVQSRPFPVYPG